MQVNGEIAVVAPRDPVPVNNGLSERLYQLARYLGDRWPVIVHYPANTGYTDEGRWPDHQPFERSRIESRVVTGLDRLLADYSPLRGPYQCHPWLYPTLRSRFTRRPPTAVVVEFPYLLPVVRAALQGLDVPVVLSEHNVEYRFARREKIPLWRGLAAFERLACDAADAVVAVSETDGDTLGAKTTTPVYVAPNGVDTGRYQPGAAARAPAVVDRDGPTLLFHGNLSNAHNATAVEHLCELVPVLRAERPDIQLVLVGPNPPSETPDGVQTTGLVDDLPAYLAGADCAVAPLASGSGTSLKIIEYLASGTPVVTTEIGAEGLAIRDGVHAVIAPDAAEMAEPVGRLLADESHARELSEAGRRLAVERYSWNSTLAVYEELLVQLTDGS